MLICVANDVEFFSPSCMPNRADNTTAEKAGVEVEGGRGSTHRGLRGTDTIV